MTRLAHTEYLYGLALVAVFGALYVLMMLWRKRVLAGMGDSLLIGRLIPDINPNRHTVKFLLAAMGFTCIVLALSRPQIGTRLEKVKREGVDVMIALDVSRSMLAEDIRPNRLERGKYLIAALLERLETERVGLIIYAGKAYLQLPLTTDYSAAGMFLQAAGTHLVPTQGTAIGEAVGLAVRSFVRKEKEHKAVIIFTDGENHESGAMEAIRAATEEGVRVHTVGVGLPEGGPIPVYRNGLRTGFHADKEGNIVVTRLDENRLREMAGAGNGKYVRAGNTGDPLGSILAAIGRMEKKEMEVRIFTDYEDKFQYFIAAAMFLLLMELLVSERKNKWLEGIKLFRQRKS